jgi:nicotinamide mononucleotide adenylyltransferase
MIYGIVSGYFNPVHRGHIAAIAERLDTIASVTFFNSGDRDPGTYNIAESDVCERLAVIPFFLELPKVNSSSQLLS